MTKAIQQYVELHCHSVFSLLDGASEPEALVARAHRLGMPALALTDHNDLGGVVRFAAAAEEAGIGGIPGSEITIDVEGRLTHLVLLAESRTGYGNISSLVTRGRMDHPRGNPVVSLDTLARHATGVFALTGCPRGLVPALAAEGRVDQACEAAATLLDVFDRRLAIEVWDHNLPEEREVVRRLIPIARSLGVPWVVTNDVHYANPRGRIIHDVLCSLRHGRTLDEMGTLLRPNGEWYLKSAVAMSARWSDPAGLRASLDIAERCTFRLGQLQPRLPSFPLPPGVTSDDYLASLVRQGALERWGKPPDDLDPKYSKQLNHELDLIARLGYAGYFLIVWDIVRFASREGILCQGRGSAANSAVCYCLGITAVDPIRLQLLFERFLSEDRREAPDIDIDFAHRDRERVLQYVYDRYGREHAAMVCEHITWRGRSAIRDSARVLGFSVQQADILSALSDRFSARSTAAALRNGGSEPGVTDRHMKQTGEERRNPTTAIRSATDESTQTVICQAGLDPGDPRVRVLPDVVEGLHQAPRHRSIHSGGFVLTAEPLRTVVPIEPASMPGRTVIQWERDDLDPAGVVKFDLLGLGMLTVLQDCLHYIRASRGVDVDLGQLDMSDQAVYDRMCAADTIGVFQIESRAQMNTLPRLKPRCFYDLVIEVALIRPGPIQGDMVHPFLRRRAGVEEVTYPHPSLEPILRRTLGVPLFQEQGMQVAITAAGFTPGEADNLRRAMGHKRSREKMAALSERLISGMVSNGFSREIAERVFNQINGFADYGFPESHAASFALIVYASAYLRHYYAPEFAAAILNAQPMGFYSVGTLIEDARRHGVRVLPVDLTVSAWDSSLEVPGGRVVIPDGGKVGVRELPAFLHQGDRSTERGQGATGKTPALRLGLRLVRGLGSVSRGKLETALRDGGPFSDIPDVVQRSGLDQRGLRALAEAGAFDTMVADVPPDERRRVALWRVLEALRGSAGPLAATPPRRTRPPLPPMTLLETTDADYRLTGLSLNGHPMRHLRTILEPNGVMTAKQLSEEGRDGARVAHAGLVICRQRPGTAKGFVFLSLEDETGILNVVVTPRRFERQAMLISSAPLLLVRGTLQVESGVVNLRGEEFIPLKADAGESWAQRHDFH